MCLWPPSSLFWSFIILQPPFFSVGLETIDIYSLLNYCISAYDRGRAIFSFPLSREKGRGLKPDKKARKTQRWGQETWWQTLKLGSQTECCPSSYTSSPCHRLGLLLFGHWVVSNSLSPHGLQHTRSSVLHYLPELAQIHVHWVRAAI